MPDIRPFTGKKKTVTKKPRIACSCGSELFFLTADSFICNVCHEEFPLENILETYEKSPETKQPGPDVA